MKSKDLESIFAGSFKMVTLDTSLCDADQHELNLGLKRSVDAIDDDDDVK